MRAVCLRLVIVVYPDHTHLLCFLCLFVPYAFYILTGFGKRESI